jgi:hypothetical protein
MKTSTFLIPLFAFAASVLAGCGDDASEDSPNSGGTSGKGGTNAKAGTSGEGGSDAKGGTEGGGGAPSEGGSKPGPEVFTPPAEPGKGGFWVTVSGEDLAGLGYDWTSSSLSDGDPPAFVDGWAVKFEHVIVTVANIHVNEDPDKDEGNPQDVGALVASADGPWAVDVTIGGDVVGKSESPDEKTIPIAAFAEQDDGTPFDPESSYAFSYETVAASADAKLTNLDAEGLELYAEAQDKGWSMILAGTAIYKGPEPEVGSVFASIPTEVKFTLGLKNPSSYLNCRNTDLTAVGDEFPRGIKASPTKSTTVQITIHTDHAFWDTLNVEGTPLHFDPIAANASSYGTPSEPGVVSIEDLADVDVTGLTTKDGETLPWRSLVSDYTAPAGQMKYDANGTSFRQANSLAAYLAYSAASGNHMNADGECEIKNNFTP